MCTRGGMATILRVTGGALLLLALVPPVHGAGEFYLYEPKPVEKPAAPVEPGDGILVRNIIIKRGDSLSRLSRKYAGKGSYFPQILLFNKIANPDLIYAGKELMVPVTTGAGLNRTVDGEGTPGQPPVAEKKRKKSAKTATHQPATTAKKSTAPVPSDRSAVKAAPPVILTTSAEQKLYEKAIAEYRSNQYGQAQQTFATFLERYPSSPLAPDAALYKAECLLKQAEEQQ